MRKLTLTTAVLAALSSPAFAQDASHMFRVDADPAEIHASELIGMRIYRSEGADAEGYAGVQDDWDDIGEVNDIILSREGAVEAVLLDIGGFLGIGENQIAVDMDALRFVSDDATADNTSDYFIVLNATRESLEQAPAYHWDDPAPATDGASTGMSSTSATADVAAAETKSDTATGAVADTGTAAPDPNTGMRDPIEREGYMVVEEVDLTAERLTGAPAYDANDAWIGEVSDLVLSDNGRIASVVVDVGGFLGIGEKPVQMDMNDIDILRAENGSDIRVYISKTKDEMEAMPDYRG